MTKIHPNFTTQIHDYLLSINSCFTSEVITSVEILAEKLYNAWICGNQVFICGNGGSGANALHMSNDFHYGIGACSDGKTMTGLKVEALSANTAILTSSPMIRVTAISMLINFKLRETPMIF